MHCYKILLLAWEHGSKRAAVHRQRRPYHNNTTENHDTNDNENGQHQWQWYASSRLCAPKSQVPMTYEAAGALGRVLEEFSLLHPHFLYSDFLYSCVPPVIQTPYIQTSYWTYGIQDVVIDKLSDLLYSCVPTRGPHVNGRAMGNRGTSALPPYQADWCRPSASASLPPSNKD